jgi:hypothetical protein
MIILIISLPLLTFLSSLQQHIKIETPMMFIYRRLHRVTRILILLMTVRLLAIVFIITVHYILLFIALHRESTVELLSVLLVLQMHLQMNHSDLIQIESL